VAGESDGHDGEAGEGGATLAQPRDEVAGEAALDDRRHQADEGEGKAGLFRAPDVAVAGVEHPDAGIDLMGDAADEVADGEPEDEAVAAQLEEGADWVRAPQAEGAAVLRLERLGQDEESVEAVRKGEDPRRDEGDAQAVVPEPA